MKLHINKYYSHDDRTYIDPTGCHWDNPQEFIQGYMFGFCCCGEPNHALSLVRDVLRHIKNVREKVYESELSFGDAWKQWEQEGKKICGERELYFVYYFLHLKNLTEHGGSVPGWLTDAGEELLHDLDAILENK